MEIDLARLREIHPRLPADVVLVMMGRAALALGRNGHESGVRLSVDLEQVIISCMLSWLGPELNAINQHDYHRITEDGAEAVALAVAHQHRAWRVVRRMQREEHADWLLEDMANEARTLIALEVSGVDRGSIASRLAEKLAQVANSVEVDQRWAAVVGFEQPATTIRSA